MGIFGFLSGKIKKKKADDYPPPAPTPLELIKKFQETPSTPAAGPSAQVDVVCEGPLLTSEIRKYKVKGTNPATGKRKTETMLIGSWEYKDRVIPYRTYLLPPYEVSDCTLLPTEAQLDVFRRNDVPIRPGMSRRDASAVIGHIIGDSSYRDDLKDWEYSRSRIDPYPGTLSRSFLQFAVDHQIELSGYYTKEEAKNILKGSLPRGFAKQINSL